MRQILLYNQEYFFFVFDQKERDYNFCVIDFIIILKQFSVPNYCMNWWLLSLQILEVVYSFFVCFSSVL